jgi:hypothetical protein
MADIVFNPVAGVPFSGGLRMHDCGDGSFAPTGLSISGLSPVASLTNVSATGPGAVLDNTGVRNNHSLTITSGAGVASGAVKLEGSQDNVNWFQLIAPVTAPAAGATTNTIASLTPVRYLRANITTIIGGGTVTALVASAG